MARMCRLSWFLMLILVAACSALPTHKDDLEKKNEDFMTRVRWHDFSGASLHFDDPWRDDFVERFVGLDDLNITEFAVVRLDVDVPEEKVTVHYRVEYYLLPSATVRTKRFTLTWQKLPDVASGRSFWRITEAFPELS